MNSQTDPVSNAGEGSTEVAVSIPDPGQVPVPEAAPLQGGVEEPVVSLAGDEVTAFDAFSPLWFGGLLLALVVGLGGGLALARRGHPREEVPPAEVSTVAETTGNTEHPGGDPVVDSRTSMLERMRGGLARTSAGFGRRLALAFGRDTVDEQLFEELEEALLTADVGVKTTTRLLEGLRGEARAQGIEEPERLQALLREAMLALFKGGDRDMADNGEEGPTVVLVVGVNGSGKTTTIGKLAARYGRAGKRVLIGAGDTFRAGAIEQLRVWSERTGADFVAHQEGADPAAVLFDALDAAVGRGSDVVLCDTAGRLQSKQPLMAELAKVHKVVGRAVSGAPHEVLLVLDATMGQNALSQARTFGEVTGVTGVVLTKLDGTAKGGIVLAVSAELGLPVKYIGMGEQVDDLRPFDPEAFVEALMEPASPSA